MNVEPKCMDRSKPIRHIEVWSRKFNSAETDFRPVSCKLRVFFNCEEQITDYIHTEYKVTIDLFEFILQNAENMKVIVNEVGKDISKLARSIISREADRARRSILENLPTKIGIVLLRNLSPLSVLIIDIESNCVIDVVRLKVLGPTSQIASLSDWFGDHCGFTRLNERYHWFVDDASIVNILNYCGISRNKIHTLGESSDQGNSDEMVTIRLQLHKMKSEIERKYAFTRIETWRNAIMLKPL